MAPIDNDIYDKLKEVISKLEARVEHLETRLHAHGEDSPPKLTRSAGESLRMILIGPPGAGTLYS